jgi:ubiquinone/menaquinone biosynthesis C-methylase UbiE
MAEQDRLLHSIEDVTATMEGEPRVAATPEAGPGEAQASSPAEPPEKAYRPLDIIQPEGFQRTLLDRNISKPNSYFSQAFGQEKAVLQATADRLAALGSVTLLDIGCGTGNTLRTWAAMARQYAANPDDVTALGINLHDYSQESRYAPTRDAVANGQVKYTVGNAEKLHDFFPAQSADVVLACMSLIHMRRPTMTAVQIARVLRPGGIALFNVSEDLNMSGSPFMEAVYKLEDAGFIIDTRTGIVSAPDPSKSWPTLFVRMERPEAS